MRTGVGIKKDWVSPVVWRCGRRVGHYGRFAPGDFTVEESGAVLLKDDGRKRFLSAWQEKKQEVINHPFLQEKLSWGLVPYVQATLLARYLRGDLDGYPPFLWK